MRKIVAQTFVSLDGVMEAPEKWQLANDLMDEEMGKWVFAGYEAADALLLGRVTYQDFAGFWPKQSDDDPFAKKINGLRKYVVSSTLTALEWKNSQLIKGNVPAEITKLKQQAGKDILIPGSAKLVSGLTKDGLVDEYQVLVHPIVVGRGKHLFAEGLDPTLLTLVETKTFGTGAVALVYARKGKAVLG